MGHERVGSLPKSRRWRSIVGGVAQAPSGVALDHLAVDTLYLVKGRFRAFQEDEAVRASFAFLVSVSVAARSEDLRAMVGGAREPTPMALAMALRARTAGVGNSAEYRTMAQDAAIEAMGRWFRAADVGQGSLFSEARPADVWRGASDGRGFSELARLFFASVTERYLGYFLEREAGRVSPTVEDRQRLAERLREHADEVSRHAFESAKITQSFAAAWFNGNAAEGEPSDEAVRGFLGHAFGKMRDEMNREGGLR